MKISDIITESAKSSELEATAQSALPGAKKWVGLDNSNPYHAYRFGVALAGSPDVDMSLEGPIGQKMMTIAYTDAEENILNAAGKHLGLQSEQVTDGASTEHGEINKLSPVRGFKGYPR